MNQHARAPSDTAPDRASQPASAEIRFVAADGFPIAGTLYQGDGDGPLLLISSATAVPRGLYAGFAAAAVAAGARAALVYDYRGTGGSARPKGWRSRIGMKDWAVLDLPAAAYALDAAEPGHRMVGLGQSFGGQALGLSGIADRFERYAMVATMSGHFGGLDDRNARRRMLGIGVPVSLACRQMPRWLGLGEPIPGTVFRDWARWCRMENYFFDDPSVTETERFKAVRTPILSLGMTDDAWGTRRAVAALMKHYTDADIEQRWISPADAGGEKIGHLGFFRSRFSKTLWPGLIGWLVEGEKMAIGTRG